MAAGTDGSFAVALGPSYGTGTLVLRRLDGSGAKQGGDHVVSTAATGASVAADPAGGFVVVWEEYAQGRNVLFGRHLFPNSPNFGVTRTSDDPYFPAVAVSTAGRVVVLWETSEYREYAYGTIFGQWLDAAGARLGWASEFDETNLGTHDSPRVAADAHGNVGMAWRSHLSWSSPVVRVAGANGIFRGPQRALAPDANAPMVNGEVAIAATPGGFVAVWAEERRHDHIITGRALVGHAVSRSGVLVGERFTIATLRDSDPPLDVAVDAHGRGIAVWRDSDDFGTESIRAASFDPASGSASPTTLLATATGDGSEYSRPRIAVGPGGFMLLWNDFAGTGLWARPLTLCGNGVPDAPEQCDDGNRRAGDCCSAACTLEDVAGTCWRLAGETTASFTSSFEVGGRGVICKARCRASTEGTLILLDDGGYRLPNGEALCANERTLDLTDEVGRRRRSGRRERLQPSNLAELRSDVLECSGGRRLRHTGTRIVVDDGGSLQGSQVTTARVPGRRPVDIRTTTKLVGVPLGAVRPTPPPPKRPLQLCIGDVTLRCRLR